MDRVTGSKLIVTVGQGKMLFCIWTYLCGRHENWHMHAFSSTAQKVLSGWRLQQDESLSAWAGFNEICAQFTM